MKSDPRDFEDLFSTLVETISIKIEEALQIQQAQKNAKK